MEGIWHGVMDRGDLPEALSLADHTWLARDVSRPCYVSDDWMVMGMDAYTERAAVDRQ
ncbi:hypothetical protein [Emergencia sp. 1XD21-10]|uniref:hypothetical protein n=1 Tax=Emergencia sp. 1XD21-10 TaxID=2304569 RepID=UPI00137A3F4B|nr:hypothetical protein [Emergencia sp. 1XD21-10]